MGNLLIPLTDDMSPILQKFDSVLNTISLEQRRCFYKDQLISIEFQLRLTQSMIIINHRKTPLQERE